MAFFEPWLVNTMAGPPVQNPNELDEAAFRELPPSPPVGIRLLNPGATRPHQLLHLVCGFRWDNVKAGTIRILTNRGSLPIGPHQKPYLGVAGEFKGLKAGKRQNALTTEGHGGKRQASRL